MWNTIVCGRSLASELEVLEVGKNANLLISENRPWSRKRANLLISEIRDFIDVYVPHTANYYPLYILVPRKYLYV